VIACGEKMLFMLTWCRRRRGEMCWRDYCDSHHIKEREIWKERGNEIREEEPDRGREMRNEAILIREERVDLKKHYSNSEGIATETSGHDPIDSLENEKDPGDVSRVNGRC
jgi:hypothetical protein